MRSIIKIFLSFLLIYEPLVYWILSDIGICKDMFSRDFCNMDFRYVVIMGTPIILMSIYLMWEMQIKSMFVHKKQHLPKQQKQKQYLPKPKQRFIYPLEAIGRYFAKICVVNQTASRSEYFCALITLSAIGFIVMPAVVKIFESGIMLLGILGVLVILCPLSMYSLNARRWNDIGWNGKIMAIIPLVLCYLCLYFSLFSFFIPNMFSVLFGGLLLCCSLFQFIAFCFPSKLRNNKYRNAQQDLEERLLANIDKHVSYDDDED